MLKPYGTHTSGGVRALRSSASCLGPPGSILEGSRRQLESESARRAGARSCIAQLGIAACEPFVAPRWASSRMGGGAGWRIASSRPSDLTINLLCRALTAAAIFWALLHKDPLDRELGELWGLLRSQWWFTHDSFEPALSAAWFFALIVLWRQMDRSELAHPAGQPGRSLGGRLGSHLGGVLVPSPPRRVRCRVSP